MRAKNKAVGVATLAVATITGTVIGLGSVKQPAGSAAPAADAQTLAAQNVSYVQPDTYVFRTVDDPADPTFNQLLGINGSGVIAGYFGSGAAGHPNKGYTVHNDAAAFTAEDFPGSVQTQVTGLNDHGVTVGFFSTMNTANQQNDNVGWYARGGTFHKVVFPTKDMATPPVGQLLGVNDDDTAVGFYNDAAGNSHGFEYSIDHQRFHDVTVSGATSTTAAAINGRGDVAGFFTGANGDVSGFLMAGGKLTRLSYPGAAMTQALGVNDRDEVVGVYQTGTGNTAQTHGFTWTPKQAFLTVDDPDGVGATTVNGVNDAGTLVGFYTDAAGNTHGMLAAPQKTTTTRHLSLNPMPQGSVTLSEDSMGMLSAQVTALGFTPGSQHTAEIVAPGRAGVVARFDALLTADATGRIQASTMTSGTVGRLPEGSRFVIQLGAGTDDSTRSAFAAEPIAQTDRLPGRPSGDDPMPLKAVDVNPDGADQGRLTGTATLTFNTAAHTLTVTVNAAGLTPGAHATHIHVGSCASQGGVQYMLNDLVADAHGRVSGQTQTIQNVAALPAPGTWYLNVHQGDMAGILVDGKPSLAFRPLLCANI